MSINISRPRAFLNTQGYVIPDSFENEAFRGEYTGDNLIYAGFARPGSDEGSLVWQIFKMAYSGANLTSITWPFRKVDPLDLASNNTVVSTDYEFSWTNRTSYTYG